MSEAPITANQSQNLLGSRLFNQALTDPRFTLPEDVVGWFGAMQAQEFAVAKWSIGQRMRYSTESEIAAAIDDGRILRTHVLRPTWHFVARNDIRWILTATAHRVHQLNAFMYRQLELDEELLASTLRIVERVLSDGHHRTRAELKEGLEKAGVAAEGMRLGYIVHYAELEGLICSGAVRGKQQTYALIDERAPDALVLRPDDALAELTRRYFQSHGPATVKDLAGWASMTLADVRRGIAMVGSDLDSTEIDGLTYWFGANAPGVGPPIEPRAHLLQGYDEYIMGYFESRSQMAGRDLFDREAPNNLLHVLLIDGLYAGRWKRTVKRTEVQVAIRADRTMTDSERAAVSTEAELLGQFYGLPATIVH